MDEQSASGPPWIDSCKKYVCFTISMSYPDVVIAYGNIGVSAGD